MASALQCSRSALQQRGKHVNFSRSATFEHAFLFVSVSAENFPCHTVLNLLRALALLTATGSASFRIPGISLEEFTHARSESLR